jgi:hypothetical protein
VPFVVVVDGEAAAGAVEACTSVSGEFSFTLEVGAVGRVGAANGFAWESAAGAAWRESVAGEFWLGAGELICASERERTPSNAAVPPRKCLKRLDIIMNGKLKSAGAFKAGSRPAPLVQQAAARMVKAVAAWEKAAAKCPQETLLYMESCEKLNSGLRADSRPPGMESR